MCLYNDPHQLMKLLENTECQISAVWRFSVLFLVTSRLTLSRPAENTCSQTLLKCNRAFARTPVSDSCNFLLRSRHLKRVWEQSAHLYPLLRQLFSLYTRGPARRLTGSVRF